MNASNRYAIETLARQHQARIEQQLRVSAELGEDRPGAPLSPIRVTPRAAVIIAAAVLLSMLLATALTFSLVFALSVLR